MKRQNLRTASLIVVTFTYLLFGAAIFGYLESEHENLQRQYLELIETRLKQKYNISEVDYTVLSTVVIKSVPHKAGIQWKFAGAFYFATTVVTTIGYGHSTPSTVGGRSFCMIYALIGIPLGLVMFQSIGERLNTFVGTALRYGKRCFKARNPEVTQTNLVMVVSVLSTILMTSMAAVFAKYERWDYFDSLYYCFITLTTIGFGDYVALQKEAALQSKPEYVVLSLIFILFGLSVVSSAVNLLVLKFLTLNTEDERRDEKLRVSEARNPIQLEGDVITSATGKLEYAREKRNNSDGDGDELAVYKAQRTCDCANYDNEANACQCSPQSTSQLTCNKALFCAEQTARGRRRPNSTRRGLAEASKQEQHSVGLAGVCCGSAPAALAGEPPPPHINNQQQVARQRRRRVAAYSRERALFLPPANSSSGDGGAQRRLGVAQTAAAANHAHTLCWRRALSSTSSSPSSLSLSPAELTASGGGNGGCSQQQPQRLRTAAGRSWLSDAAAENRPPVCSTAAQLEGRAPQTSPAADSRLGGRARLIPLERPLGAQVCAADETQVTSSAAKLRTRSVGREPSGSDGAANSKRADLRAGPYKSDCDADRENNVAPPSFAAGRQRLARRPDDVDAAAAQLLWTAPLSRQLQEAPQAARRPTTKLVCKCCCKHQKCVLRALESSSNRLKQVAGDTIRSSGAQPPPQHLVVELSGGDGSGGQGCVAQPEAAAEAPMAHRRRPAASGGARRRRSDSARPDGGGLSGRRRRRQPTSDTNENQTEIFSIETSGAKLFVGAENEAKEKRNSNSSGFSA